MLSAKRKAVSAPTRQLRKRVKTQEPDSREQLLEEKENREPREEQEEDDDKETSKTDDSADKETSETDDKVDTEPDLVGRTGELKHISDFVLSRIQSCQPGCLYIAGSPGTGKSAMVNAVLSRLPSSKTRLASVNCMALSTSKAIYSKILHALDTKKAVRLDSVKALSSLRTLLTTAGRGQPTPYIIFLDEVDALIARDQDALHSVFELPFLQDSRAIVVAVANALDLTERWLPRLRAKSYTPELLTVQPYTASQIGDILRHTWAQQEQPAFAPAAIDFVARKVATASGDLRRALDVCRRAVRIAQVAKVSFVSIPHVVKAFGADTSQQQTSLGKIRSLNFSGKLVLVAAASLVQETTTGSSSTKLTYGALYDHYVAVCASRHVGVPAVAQSEFIDVAARLESLGIIAGGGTAALSKHGHRRQVFSLLASMDDIRQGVLSSTLVENAGGEAVDTLLKSAMEKYLSS